ncbi:MAG: serine acetyltransferase [Bacteroidetes bacterium]|nr:serine acetyltransferase [Bacteroidota bacterium]
MNTSEVITESIRQLSDYKQFKTLSHQQKEGTPLPSVDVLEEIVRLTRAILFPGYFGRSAVDRHTIKYHIGVNVEELYHLLTEQVIAGLCFSTNLEEPKKKAVEIATQFISHLPCIRERLATDVEATYIGDPASKSFGEVIFCYPAIRAISNYRIAHELLELGVPLIPRIITEMAHSETGIDIHPGATIGNGFTIDHGTGVVIGETAIIGNNVKLYQGVTLGAKSFPLDEKGKPIKGILRHPILEDDVIIYSNSTILGRITIGKGSVIGGNIWIDHDIPSGSRIMQSKPKK